MMTLTEEYTWLKFTQEMSDKLENTMFQEVTQTIEPLSVIPELEKKKEEYFDSEDELYASLGITKK